MMTSANPHTVGIPGGMGRQHGNAKISSVKPNARWRSRVKISRNVTRSSSPSVSSRRTSEVRSGMGRRRKRARSPRGVSASIEWGLPGRWLGRGRHSNGRSTARVTGVQPGDRSVQHGVGRRIRPADAARRYRLVWKRPVRRIRGPPHRSLRPPSGPARRHRPRERFDCRRSSPAWARRTSASRRDCATPRPAPRRSWP